LKITNHLRFLTSLYCSTFFICRTYLYSLTKQDVALIDVPGMYEASRPIMHYIKHTIEMYAVKKTVRFDRNQPHVLKYSADDKSKHTGVEVSSKYVIFLIVCSAVYSSYYFSVLMKIQHSFIMTSVT